MNSQLIFIHFCALLAAASIHHPFVDFIANSAPNVAIKSSRILGALDRFYKELDGTFAKGIINRETARIYGSVDASTLWRLLCKENKSLEEHYHTLQELLEKVKADFKSNKVLLLMEFELYSFFGCHLRSLIFGTKSLISCGQCISLAVLNEARRIEMMDKYLNVPPKIIYMEHLREIVFVYSKLTRDDVVAGDCIMTSAVDFPTDMRSKFFYHCSDRLLLARPYYTPMGEEPPSFIKDYIQSEKDILKIEGETYINRTSQAYQVCKYWHTLTSYVSGEDIQLYFDATLDFNQNVVKLFLSINRLRMIWIVSSKCLNQMQRKELRNLCCTFDFIYNLNQLLEAGQSFSFRENLMDMIIESRLI